MSKSQFNIINYFEIPSDDTKILQDFYSALFNWKFKEGKDTKDYWYTENAGIKGAILKRRDIKQSSTFFIEVGSIDECIGNAKSLGAKVVVDKQEISEGYFALLQDPQTNIIGIWESKVL